MSVALEIARSWLANPQLPPADETRYILDVLAQALVHQAGTGTDADRRIVSLRAALRLGEPLSDKDGPTVEGHIRSAISKLEHAKDLEAAQRS